MGCISSQIKAEKLTGCYIQVSVKALGKSQFGNRVYVSPSWAKATVPQESFTAQHSMWVKSQERSFQRNAK